MTQDPIPKEMCDFEDFETEHISLHPLKGFILWELNILKIVLSFDQTKSRDIVEKNGGKGKSAILCGSKLVEEPWFNTILRNIETCIFQNMFHHDEISTDHMS